MNKSILFAALAVRLPPRPCWRVRPASMRANSTSAPASTTAWRAASSPVPKTRRLAAGQVHLRRAEARAKSDGVVTGRERARLQHEANQQSRRIYRQKHDAQDRG